MSNTSQENTVFVLMPFVEELKQVYATIVMAVNQVGAGLKCMRADEDTKSREIFKGIVNCIASSKLIISDLSYENPNVFYELGTAHAFRKPAILIIKKGMEVPFDVKSYRFIEYTHTSEGLETLKLKLRDQVHDILSLDKSETFSNPVTDGLSVENKQSLYPETWPGLIAFLARKFRPWQQFLIAILVLLIGGAGGIGIYSISFKTKNQHHNIDTSYEIGKLNALLEAKSSDLDALRKSKKQIDDSLSQQKEKNQVLTAKLTEADVITEETLKKSEENYKTLLSKNEELNERIKELGTQNNLDTSNDIEKLNKLIKENKQIKLEYARTLSQYKERNQELTEKLMTEERKKPNREYNTTESKESILSEAKGIDKLLLELIGKYIYGSGSYKYQSGTHGQKSAGLGDINTYNMLLKRAKRLVTNVDVMDSKPLGHNTTAATLTSSADFLKSSLRIELHFGLE